jgi:hypothetical protein
MTRYVIASHVKERLAKKGFRTSKSLLDRLDHIVREHIDAAIIGAKNTGKTARAEHVDRGLPLLRMSKGKKRT